MMAGVSGFVVGERRIGLAGRTVGNSSLGGWIGKGDISIDDSTEDLMDAILQVRTRFNNSIL